MKTTSTNRVRVEAGGDQVVSHVGLHALGSFADRLGLGHALTMQFRRFDPRFVLHERGKVLVHAALMLAGGGDNCADIEYLRSSERLFGSVPSDSTLYRTMRQITPELLGGLQVALAGVRTHVWRRSSVTTGIDPVVLDMDATISEIHSENKQNTGPTYKGGFGFHPLLCFADATGEVLSGMLRPGNAAANNAADHLVVLDEAIAGLPPEIAAGHHDGDDPALVKQEVLVRADSAGCTFAFVHGCRNRNIGFAVAAKSNAQIHGAISRIAEDDTRWHKAVHQDGEVSKHSVVAEVTDLVDLSAWPAGTRLIIRREPLHQGAQRSLFPSLEYRYWGHYTDWSGDVVTRDVEMRAHAHVENNIYRVQESGLLKFPFTNFDANRAWMFLVCMADALVRWFQLLVCVGDLAKALPKTLRFRLWHTPARIVRTGGVDIVRIIGDWPSSKELLRIYERIPLVA
jgi:hypothetical protein